MFISTNRVSILKFSSLISYQSLSIFAGSYLVMFYLNHEPMIILSNQGTRFSSFITTKFQYICCINWSFIYIFNNKVAMYRKVQMQHQIWVCLSVESPISIFKYNYMQLYRFCLLYLLGRSGDPLPPLSEFQDTYCAWRSQVHLKGCIMMHTFVYLIF